MKNKDVEQKLYEAFNEQKPDMFQSIMEQCPKMNEPQRKPSIFRYVSQLFSRRSFAYSFTSFVVIIMFVLVIFGIGSQNNPSVYSVIAIDVNPSIVLELDENDKVINVIKNNGDADVILGTMDLIGVDSDVAINALIGSMVANGYISNITNSILLSIQSEDQVHKDEMMTELTAIINSILSGSSIDGSVITQSLDVNQDVEELAKTLSISEAKMELILSIIEIDPRMLAEDLAKLSINDLNLLLETKNYVIDNVKHTGTASNIEIIPQAEVFQIALTNLGLVESDILEYEIELEQENGIMVYEIEIETISIAYSLIIDAKRGTILDIENESNDDSEEPSDEDDDVIYENVLSEEEIMQLVINDLNLIGSMISNLEFDLDFENGIPFYDISFDYGSIEYELSVNAETGYIYSNSNDEDGYEFDEDDEIDEEDEIDEDEFDEDDLGFNYSI